MNCVIKFENSVEFYSVLCVNYIIIFLDRIREKKEPLSGAATPTQDSNHGDVDMRLTTTSQSIQSVVSACSKSGTENGTQSTSTPATFLPKRRCRDFDGRFINYLCMIILT